MKRTTTVPRPHHPFLILVLLLALPVMTYAGRPPVEACTPVAQDDVTCDGIDDDCDGSFDEDFPPGPYGIQLGGGSAYVDLDLAPALGASSFTLEAWILVQGTGVTASSGSGGVTAVPLITKGRGEADGSNLDMNYFLGIRGSDRVLVADFEDMASGGNHPVAGATAVPEGTWVHVAATYDGTAWKLYLNGVLDGGVTVNQTPRFDSVQHSALGSALTSTGAPAGFFDGTLDEVRIWNYARTETEIQAWMDQEIASAAGLVGRWGLNEGCGTAAADSSGSGVDGVLTGSDWAWTVGSPFEVNHPPEAPVLVAPSDGAFDVSTEASLEVTVSDPDADDLTVTFLGRQAPAPAESFTLVTLPDTQYYSESYPATFLAQTGWAVATRDALHTVFVTHLGDIVDSGDTSPTEWVNADTALSLLDGEIPYGLGIGNHDMSSAGVAALFDSHFPASRYAGQTWYGGGFQENKNSYQLFSAGGMDFIILHLEADVPDDVLAWADGILTTYSDRRAIVTTHIYMDASGNRTTSAYFQPDGNSGEEVWNQLIRVHCNVFLVLAGHAAGEARLTSDNACGDPVHQLLQDYQSRSNGGDGWLRYLTFSPGENLIYAYTYSPTLDQYETDSGSQFVLAYDMQAAPFSTIAVNAGVPSDASTSAPWSGLAPSTAHEWYVSVSDGTSTTDGPTWSFVTAQDCTDPAPDDPTCDGVDDDCDGSFDEDYVPTPTACGLGVCAATGELSCVAGVEVDSCEPGTPTGGWAVGFDGAGDRVDLGTGAAVTDFGTGSFTVEGWLRADAASTYGGIFRMGRQGAFSQVAVQFPGSSPFDRLTVSVEDTAGHQVDLTPVTIPLGTWMHFAAVVDRSVNELRLYLNGVPAGTADGSSWGVNPVATTDGTVLGAARLSDGSLSYFLDGALDELRIWNVARTGPEIAASYLQEIPTATNLIGRWGFNDGIGATAGDSAGTNPGTLAGASWEAASPLVEIACDGIDDDCDGIADENYVSDDTCGVGACLTGNTPSTCVDGTESPCLPGTPAADDATCDGVDDDCDASADEDFVPYVTSCGVGACEATGTASCVGGTEVDDCVPGAPSQNYGLDLDGPREHVTLGNPAGLGLDTFTLEAWFRRQGAGASANTGTGGVLAIPLITKGRGEADGSNLDMNYFLGIRESDGVLVADFEDTATGLNHPVAGTTSILGDTWYHAAATYDGTTWRLYLDGALEAESAAGATPRFDSIQPAGLGVALDSSGTPAGYFDGVIDEVRIWSIARTGPEVQAGMGVEISAAPGLAARWGMNQGAGDVVVDSAGAGLDGVRVGGAWVAGTPFVTGPVAQLDHALSLDGSDDHVAFGAAPSLGLGTFTLETWFQRRGAGVTASTGTGGVVALPLLTKGRGEADGDNRDMNWFLGIRGSDGVLAADFEDTATGGNHPVAGVTAILQGVWYHAAATYDGTTWRLYLDGQLEAELAVGQTPRADSIQHAALGTAMNSSGVSSGAFPGLLDEARVWNVARTGPEIVASMRQAIASAPGLVGRWALDEGSGATAGDSTGTTPGAIAGAAWVDGVPFQDVPVVDDATCDGIDQDCDGLADEDYVAAPTTCGVGECAGNVGERLCLAGGVLDDTCDPFAGAEVEVCDGLDNDCNGVPDDAAPPLDAPRIDRWTLTQWSWTPGDFTSGVDAVSGDMLLLLGTFGDYAAATESCLADDVPTDAWVDLPPDPAPGQGKWFLARGVNCGGAGSYDSGSASQVEGRDAEIELATVHCP